MHTLAYNYYYLNRMNTPGPQAHIAEKLLSLLHHDDSAGAIGSEWLCPSRCNLKAVLQVGQEQLALRLAAARRSQHML